MPLLARALVWALPALGASAAISSFRSPMGSPGHVMSGITIRAAGVVPYVVRPGHGVYFLLQDIVNGSRAGKLCDFGGRCEASDANAFVTAARELNEETGFAFGGDVDEVASALRSSSSVRILNRLGRYVCFFLKMEHAVDTSLMPPVDHSADDSAERRFRWWRADELLGQVHEDQLLERMLAPSPVLPPLSGPTAGRSPSDGSSSDRPLSSFHKAICKTLALENAHPDAHERWHFTVGEKIAAAKARADSERREHIALHAALASSAIAFRQGDSGLPAAYAQPWAGAIDRLASGSGGQSRRARPNRARGGEAAQQRGAGTTLGGNGPSSESPRSHPSGDRREQGSEGCKPTPRRWPRSGPKRRAGRGGGQRDATAPGRGPEASSARRARPSTPRGASQRASRVQRRGGTTDDPLPIDLRDFAP